MLTAAAKSRGLAEASGPEQPSDASETPAREPGDRFERGKLANALETLHGPLLGPQQAGF